MSLFERYENTINDMAAIGWSLASLPLHQNLMDTCFNYTGWESRPSLRSLLSDKAIVLQNSHPAITYPLPLSTNFVEVAGIHINPRKQLPEV
jgi:glucuronosyltransferase